jgi:hypothetical protein
MAKLWNRIRRSVAYQCKISLLTTHLFDGIPPLLFCCSVRLPSALAVAQRSPTIAKRLYQHTLKGHLRWYRGQYLSYAFL